MGRTLRMQCASYGVLAVLMIGILGCGDATRIQQLEAERQALKKQLAAMEAQHRQASVAESDPPNDGVPNNGAAKDRPAVSAADEFKGKIAKRFEDSVEWWPEPKAPPADSPNVVIFLLDDVGFAQVGCFGGLIETPHIDALAANGLRFNNFHTTALCSPSRASLMAGRNPHSIGLGSHALTAMGFPGYNAIVPESAKSVANYLQQTGYVNYALGKWD
ncbi:MAG: sulfatase-like hydrolase/transferase, partial [Planctomycetales bacterium]